MCRNIKPLFNFDPPATLDELEAASLQFVRKVSGMNAPTAANEMVFNRTVSGITELLEQLMQQLQTNGAPKNREVEAARARERSARRFSRPIA